MRALRDLAVRAYLPLWVAWRRYKTMPDAGAYLDQDAQTMAALDAMEDGAAHEDPELTRQRRRAARPDPRLGRLESDDPRHG